MRHGKTIAVNKTQIEKEFVEFWEILALYPPQNKYNIDKSALYWKASLDHILASEEVSKKRKKKTRIIANFYYNANGSEKLSP